MKSISNILIKIEKIFTLILVLFIFESEIYAQNEARFYIAEPVKLERDYNSLLSGYLSKLIDANAFLIYGIIGFMPAHHRTHQIDLYNSFLSYSTLLYAVKKRPDLNMKNCWLMN